MANISVGDLVERFCPWAGEPDAQIYLRPVSIDIGIDTEAGDDPGGLPLAGGPLRFARVELIVRNGDRLERATMPLDRLEAWAAARGVAGTVKERLTALTAPRTPVAGRPLGQPLLMGIVNVTPDSFSDGGDFADPSRAIAHGMALAEAGADLLDVGGESTRPGAAPLPAGTEIARIQPVVAALAQGPVPVSIDTRHAAVMQAALDSGARMINDVTALLGDPGSLQIAARSDTAVALMHMQGEPQTMQQDPRYRDAPLDVYDFLAGRIAACVAAGIDRRRIVVDPGIGFGKTVRHNLEILRAASLYHGLGCPILFGVSRKRFIGSLSRNEPPKARLAGSLAAGLAVLDQGVQILRVHDVAETAQALAVRRALRGL